MQESGETMTLEDFQWKDGEGVANYLYYDKTGRIIGEVGRAGMQISTKHFATIYKPDNTIVNLGMYINTESAKTAIENFFLIQTRTLISHE
jgi:rRNA processing protein Krr1/Pno1